MKSWAAKQVKTAYERKCFSLIQWSLLLPELPTSCIMCNLPSYMCLVLSGNHVYWLQKKFSHALYLTFHAEGSFYRKKIYSGQKYLWQSEPSVEKGTWWIVQVWNTLTYFLGNRSCSLIWMSLCMCVCVCLCVCVCEYVCVCVDHGCNDIWLRQLGEMTDVSLLKQMLYQKKKSLPLLAFSFRFSWTLTTRIILH